jgi:GDP-L-fucose synthase
MDKKRKLFLAGHNGLVGKALFERFSDDDRYQILTADRAILDLTDANSVDNYFSSNTPTDVILAAARVGGIAANMAKPVEFLVDNLAIQTNVLLASARFGVDNVMFLGSSCIYPRLAAQPIEEDSFMTGPLEPTNESYALAKIAGIRLAQAINVQYQTRIMLPMPCNVIGPGDHFDTQRSHVASALVKRFIDASQANSDHVELWGSGVAKREFIVSTDLADACHHMFDKWHTSEIVNIGTGKEISIFDLAHKIAALTGYRGEIRWDASKPDGMPRKVLDISKISRSGWTPKISLTEGLQILIQEYTRLC